MSVPLTCAYMYIGICFCLCLERIHAHVRYTLRAMGMNRKLGGVVASFRKGLISGEKENVIWLQTIPLNNFFFFAPMILKFRLFLTVCQYKCLEEDRVSPLSPTSTPTSLQVCFHLCKCACMSLVYVYVVFV
jgi:hypothetical protein